MSVAPYLGPRSLLDDDLYKFTMQYGAMRLYPNATSKIRFINRKPNDQKFSVKCVDAIKDHVRSFKDLCLTKQEGQYLSDNLSFLGPGYLAFLKDYRYDPDCVDIQRTDDGNLQIEIEGLWHREIMWEVKLMSTISECYFHYDRSDWNMSGQAAKAADKGHRLTSNGVSYGDMGTRRRRCYDSQDTFVGQNVQFADKGFIGTSNVHLAMKYGVKPLGTMAHEWIQAHSVLFGLLHANKFALDAWMNVYGGRLGIALTDTYGMQSFVNDFGHLLARQFDGGRHDSACPFKWTDRLTAHYKSLAIDPMSKTGLFSDGLNTDKAIEINAYCQDKIKAAFGIGTHFTNDFGDPALNMVIKMMELNGKPVVKLSDEPGKMSGDRQAVRVALYTHFGTSLDEEI